MAVDNLPGRDRHRPRRRHVHRCRYKGSTVQTARLGGGVTLIGGNASNLSDRQPHRPRGPGCPRAGPGAAGGRGTNSARNLELKAGGSANANGGGLYNQGTLTLENALIRSNGVTGSGIGGGVANEGTLTLNGSTVSGNTSASHAGGIYNKTGGSLTLNSVTVSGNTSANLGGGLYGAAGAILTSGGVGSARRGRRRAPALSRPGHGRRGGRGTRGRTAGRGERGRRRAAALTTTNTTVSSNTSTSSTGGIHAAGTLKLRFTTITGNSSPSRANLYREAAAQRDPLRGRHREPAGRQQLRHQRPLHILRLQPLQRRVVFILGQRNRPEERRDPVQAAGGKRRSHAHASAGGRR